MFKKITFGWNVVVFCFDLNEAFAVNSENDLLEFDNLNILMLLFQETDPLNTESVHVIIKNQTNEIETTEFETGRLDKLAHDVRRQLGRHRIWYRK